MTGTGAESFSGHILPWLLSAITFLLGLIVWFSRQMWNEQKEANRGFKETFDKIYAQLDTKVSDAKCQERFNQHKCNIESLEDDFRGHTHTSLPNSSQLIIRSVK